MVHDALVACNSYALAKAVPSLAYKFVVNKPFKLYSNLTGNASFHSLESEKEVAGLHLLSFALTGSPHQTARNAEWRTFNSSRSTSEMRFGFDDEAPIPKEGDLSEESKKRCDWWMKLEARPEEERDPKFLFRRWADDDKTSGVAPRRQDRLVTDAALAAVLVIVVAMSGQW